MLEREKSHKNSRRKKPRRKGGQAAAGRSPVRSNGESELASTLTQVMSQLSILVGGYLDRRQEATRGENAWVEEQTKRLIEISEPLSLGIAERLKADPSWVQAAVRAVSSAQPRTLFSERTSHFEREKTRIAEGFTPLIWARSKRLIEEGKRVVILIDSGTTLHTLFEHFGKLSIRELRHHDRGLDPWFKGRLSLHTNNLSGVATLMETGRADRDDRHAELVLTCFLLPGTPLPVYQAVVGDQTLKALDALHAECEASQDRFVISLITGNWLTISPETPGHGPRHPIPLARGPGHREVKEKLIAIANETYVLAPLGKIFARASLQTINRHLGHPPDGEYRKAEIPSSKEGCLKLVSTRRSGRALLSKLTNHLEGALQPEEDPSEEEFAKQVQPRHIMFDLDLKPETEREERDTEFPHPRTRDKDFMKLITLE